MSSPYPLLILRVVVPSRRRQRHPSSVASSSASSDVPGRPSPIKDPPRLGCPDSTCRSANPIPLPVGRQGGGYGDPRIRDDALPGGPLPHRSGRPMPPAPSASVPMRLVIPSHATAPVFPDADTRPCSLRANGTPQSTGVIVRIGEESGCALSPSSPEAELDPSDGYQIRPSACDGRRCWTRPRPVPCRGLGFRNSHPSVRPPCDAFPGRGQWVFFVVHDLHADLTMPRSRLRQPDGFDVTRSAAGCAHHLGDGTCHVRSPQSQVDIKGHQKRTPPMTVAPPADEAGPGPHPADAPSATPRFSHLVLASPVSSSFSAPVSARLFVDQDAGSRSAHDSVFQSRRQGHAFSHGDVGRRRRITSTAPIRGTRPGGFPSGMSGATFAAAITRHPVFGSGSPTRLITSGCGPVRPVIKEIAAFPVPERPTISSITSGLLPSLKLGTHSIQVLGVIFILFRPNSQSRRLKPGRSSCLQAERHGYLVPSGSVRCVHGDLHGIPFRPSSAGHTSHHIAGQRRRIVSYAQAAVQPSPTRRLSPCRCRAPARCEAHQRHATRTVSGEALGRHVGASHCCRPGYWRFPERRIRSARDHGDPADHDGSDFSASDHLLKARAISTRPPAS